MVSDYVDITGIDKAELLSALFNGSKQQGIGFLSARGRSNVSRDDSVSIIAARTDLYFDYLYGRVLKVDLNENPMWTGLYNRDNGDQAAEKIIERLKQV